MLLSDSQAPAVPVRASRANRALCILLTVALAATMTVLPVAQPKAFAANTKKVTVTYAQTEARSMLDMVNKFRTSSPKCWNETNTKQVTYSGRKAFVYDYDLEKVAMLRAAEMAYQGKNCGHTRPNGENYRTAFSQLPLTAVGENIAWGSGTYATPTSIFTGWREDNEKYAGQGHRRNMLDSKFNAIGIAQVKHNGISYWVQSFGSKAVNTKATAAAEDTRTVTISLDKTPAQASKPAATTAKPAKVSGLKVKPGKKKLIITWKAHTARAKGYEIWIATNKKFTKKSIVKKVTANGAAYGQLSYSGLKAKKTYYVKIRAWNKVKKNGKTVKQYSAWSAVKSAKTKK